MDYGVTKDGFVKKRYDTIYDEICSDIRTGTAIDISLNPKSYINVLMSSVADKIAAVWEVAEGVYYSLYPSTAEGMNLDYACEFAGITRNEGTSTKYYILCTGSDGAAIPAGTRIASDTQPKYYFTVSSDQVITRSSFNKATIKIAGDVSKGTTYEIDIEGVVCQYAYDAYSNDSDYIELESEYGFNWREDVELDTTTTTYERDEDGNIVASTTTTDKLTDQITNNTVAKTILYKLGEQIAASGLPFTATLNEAYATTDSDGNDITIPVLVIESTNKYISYSYDLPMNNLTSESVSSIILFESEDLDDVVLPEGSITEIASTLTTNNDGFQSCTNLATAIHGTARESDAELRQSYLAKQAYRACTTLESIKAAILMNVTDVKSVAAFENDTEYTDSNGLPCHTIAVIVDGGEESAIAEQILKYKPAGIGTYAVESVMHEVEVPTGYNSSIMIRYSDPMPIHIHLNVYLESNPGEAIPSNDICSSLVISAIDEYLSSVTSGQNIILQKAIANINSLVSGLAYVSIRAKGTQQNITLAKDDDGNVIYDDSGNATVETETETFSTVKYITVDAWHKAYFADDDGNYDITIYLDHSLIYENTVWSDIDEATEEDRT